MSRRRTLAAWPPAVVLVPGALTADVAVVLPHDDLAAMREEQPLDLGTTWVYDVLDHGRRSGTRTSHVVGTASLAGPDGGFSWRRRGAWATWVPALPLGPLR